MKVRTIVYSCFSRSSRGRDFYRRSFTLTPTEAGSKPRPRFLTPELAGSKPRPHYFDPVTSGVTNPENRDREVKSPEKKLNTDPGGVKPPNYFLEHDTA